MRLAGRLTSGSGTGADFVQLPWVLSWLSETFGLTPHPGTLNLELDANSIPRWGRVRSSREGLRLVPPRTSGHCEARWFAARVADGVPGVIVVPDIPGYPPNQIEIVAAEHLRSRLSLADGAIVRVVIPATLDKK